MKNLGRVVALDLGSRRIGVAVCDDARMLATPYETVKRSGNLPVEHAQIKQIADEVGAVLLVVGLPLTLDGSAELAAKNVLAEVKNLEKNVGLPVETHDERLTTVSASSSLDFQGVEGRDRKHVVDQLAAAIILQSWLDSAKPT